MAKLHETQKFLAQRTKLLRDIQPLSDGQLIDAVMEEVWAELPTTERKSVLLSELLDRFQEAKMETRCGQMS